MSSFVLRLSCTVSEERDRLEIPQILAQEILNEKNGGEDSVCRFCHKWLFSRQRQSMRSIAELLRSVLDDRNLIRCFFFCVNLLEMECGWRAVNQFRSGTCVTFPYEM